MSKKINIMVEISDSVYETVVTPHKQNKTFSKLITTLIQGYSENMYIRGYVEDTLDGMKQASSAELRDILGSMKESLANMGMYTDELKSTAQEGIDTFKKESEEAYSNLSAEDIKSAVMEETKELRDTVSVLKSQNDEIMKMLSLLAQNPSNSAVQGDGVHSVVVERGTPASVLKGVAERNSTHSLEVEDIVAQPVSNTQSSTPPVKAEVEHNKPVEETNYDDIDDEAIIPLQEVSDDSPEEELDGDDIMSSLLSGNSFNF